MKLKICLTQDSELATYEGIALAMTLSTFGDLVQIELKEQAFGVLLNPTSRLHGMIKSLPLYDMPNAYVENNSSGRWLMSHIQSDEQLSKVIDIAPNQYTYFDSIIFF